MRRLLPPLLLVAICAVFFAGCADTTGLEERVQDLETWVRGSTASPRPGAHQWMVETFNFLLEVKDNQCALISRVNSLVPPADQIPVPSWCTIVPPPPPLPPCELGDEAC